MPGAGLLVVLAHGIQLQNRGRRLCKLRRLHAGLCQRLAHHGRNARRQRQQLARIGGLRPGKQLLHRRRLDHLAVAHHMHLVGYLGDDRQVMGDQQHPHIGLLGGAHHQLQHLGLDGVIQRGGGLVGNQQGRLARHRNGQHHTLAHAARELERVILQQLRRPGQAHAGQQVNGLGPALAARELALVVQHLFDLVANGQHRVQ